MLKSDFYNDSIVKTLTDFAHSTCLVIEDNRTTQFLKNIVTSAVPGISIQLAQTVKDAQIWLSERSQNISKSSLYLSLVDLHLPDGSGLEIVRLLKEKEPQTQVVAVTIQEEDKTLFEALSAGAVGYLHKKNDPHQSVDILKGILRNEPPLSPVIANRLIEFFREPQQHSTIKTELTKRESETLSLLARGFTVTEVAAKMNLTADTVTSYIKVIYQKLHVANRAEASSVTLRRGQA